MISRLILRSPAVFSRSSPLIRDMPNSLDNAFLTYSPPSVLKFHLCVCPCPLSLKYHDNISLNLFVSLMFLSTGAMNNISSGFNPSSSNVNPSNALPLDWKSQYIIVLPCGMSFTNILLVLTSISILPHSSSISMSVFIFSSNPFFHLAIVNTVL